MTTETTRTIVTRQMSRQRESHLGRAGQAKMTGSGGPGGTGDDEAAGHGSCRSGGGAGDAATCKSGKRSRVDLKENNGVSFQAKCTDGAKVCETTTSCRTFPLQKGAEHGFKENGGKRQPRTETTTKQRRALIDRGRNSSQIPRKTRQEERDGASAGPVQAPAKNSGWNFEFEKMALGSIKPCVVLMPPMDTSLPVTPGSSHTIDSSYISTINSTCHPVPDGVVDIDAKWDDLVPSTYSRDIMEYWLRLETKCVMIPGFLDTSPEVTPRMRGVLMDWLLQVQYHEELQNETMHLCRVLIDRILAQGGVLICKLQLVGITCLLIASKFCERFCTEIKTLCYLTDSTYTREEVIDYEKEVLVNLQWDITSPVCTNFLERFLEVHDHMPEIRHLSMYLMDLSVTNMKLAYVLPSRLAAAALLLSRRLLLPGDMGRPTARHATATAAAKHADTYSGLLWTPALQFYTTYDIADLLAEVKELESLIAKAPVSNFQGARNTYNTPERCCVSYHPRLNEFCTR